MPRVRVTWKVQLGSFIPFSPPGCPSGRLFWPCHASYDLSVQELHIICDHSRHLCTLPHRPDVWTHHQAGDKRAQGQVEPGLPAEEMPAQCPVLYSPPLYSLPTPSCERRIKKKKIRTAAGVGSVFPSWISSTASSSYESLCATLAAQPAAFVTPLLADSRLPACRQVSIVLLELPSLSKSDWYDLQLKQFLSKFLKKDIYLHTDYMI